MNSEEERYTIAYHVDVTALVPELGSARFVFRSKSGTAHSEPEHVEIPIFIPYQVLESLANGIPQILADMRAAGCDQLYSGKKTL